MTSSYIDYEEEAHKLIERLLQSSVERLCREQSNEAAKNQSTQMSVEWPKGKAFTVETGLKTIEQLVKVKIVRVRYSFFYFLLPRFPPTELEDWGELEILHRLLHPKRQALLLCC